MTRYGSILRNRNYRGGRVIVFSDASLSSRYGTSPRWRASSNASGSSARYYSSRRSYYNPTRKRVSENPVPRRYPAEQDYTLKEAMTTSSFRLLAVSSGFLNTVHPGISFLMAPVMVWFLQGEGLSEEDRLPIAAAFIGILPLSALVFYPIVGLPSDRISKTKSSAVCMVSGALSMVAL